MKTPDAYLEDLGRTAVTAAAKAGAGQSEAYLISGEKLSVGVYKGAPESYETAMESGAGVRVIKSGRTGYAYTTELTERGVSVAAERAAQNAAVSDADPNNGLPENIAAEFGRKGLILTDPEYAAPTAADKLAFAIKIEEAALKTGPNITGCESAGYSEEEETVAIVNSLGFSGSYTRQTCFGYASVIAAEKDDVQTGFSYGTGRALHRLDADAIGGEAAERALRMLGASPMPSVTTTVVFDPLAFISVLAAMSPALSADAAQKGRSFLGGLSGKLVASKAFTLIDDGRMADGLYSTPFDDEGSPTGRSPVIEEGVLKTLLYNAYAARKDNASPTGNGRRGSFRGIPATAPTNLYVEPGTLSAARIIESVGDGLLVLGLQGMHAGVSAVSGQFSAGAYGIRIRGGRLAEPVREITIASTCADILKNVAIVGSDIRFIPMGANIGSPTVVVEGMVVSGR